MLKRYFCGNNINRMPNFAFRMMTLLYRIMDIFYPFEERIRLLSIQEGERIVDYGCGPARYTRRFSDLVGKNGTHEMQALFIKINTTVKVNLLILSMSMRKAE